MYALHTERREEGVCLLSQTCSAKQNGKDSVSKCFVLEKNIKMKPGIYDSDNVFKIYNRMNVSITPNFPTLMS